MQRSNFIRSSCSVRLIAMWIMQWRQLRDCDQNFLCPYFAERSPTLILYKILDIMLHGKAYVKAGRQNSHGGISDFRVSNQIPYKQNCHDSRTSNDIDMKLGSMTKLDKRNMMMSKNSDNNVVSTNCDFIVIFPIYG